MTDDEYEVMLHDAVGDYYSDPLGFVQFAFEWGKGDLAGFSGPDTWQIDILNAISEGVSARRFDGVNAVSPIQIAVSSGHG